MTRLTEFHNARFRTGRRNFIAGSAAAATAAAMAPRLAFGTPNNPAAGDVIVTVFLRGGMDGLSAVVPYADSRYYDARPTIAVPAPNTTDRLAGALDLDGSFGLHPAFAPLYDSAWNAGNLAIVPATGLTDGQNRSHFNCQLLVEQGGTGAEDGWGWLGRYTWALGADGAAPAVGRDAVLQRALWGHPNALAINSIDNFGLDDFHWRVRDQVRGALESMYPNGSAGLLEQTSANALDAYRQVELADPLQYAPEADYGDHWSRWDWVEAAQLIKAEIGVRSICIDAGSWDHHSGLGTIADGNFRTHAYRLANNLTNFIADLGSRMDEVTIVLMSEFGRSIEENGDAGVEHGLAGPMFVLGNNVAGGIYGAEDFAVVHDPAKRDISIAVDQRTVLNEVIRKRGGMADPDTLSATVFPTWTHDSADELGLISALGTRVAMNTIVESGCVIGVRFNDQVRPIS